MTSWEYTLVLGTIAIGIVPGFFSYQYLNSHGGVTAFLGKDYTTEDSLASTIVATQTNEKSVVADMYHSRPQKENGGSCLNSNYVSFVMVLAKDDTFVLAKQCESTRDPQFSWQGTVTSTEATTTLSVLSETTTVYEEPFEIVLVRKDNTLIVETSTLKEITPKTSFSSILD
jgi:hypothetical protein